MEAVFSLTTGTFKLREAKKTRSSASDGAPTIDLIPTVIRIAEDLVRLASTTRVLGVSVAKASGTKKFLIDGATFS